MYGQVLGVSNVATGVAILPNTGNSRVLFVTAMSLMVSGLIIFVAATVVARKARRQNEAK